VDVTVFEAVGGLLGEVGVEADGWNHGGEHAGSAWMDECRFQGFMVCRRGPTPFASPQRCHRENPLTAFQPRTRFRRTRGSPHPPKDSLRLATGRVAPISPPPPARLRDIPDILPAAVGILPFEMAIPRFASPRHRASMGRKRPLRAHENCSTLHLRVHPKLAGTGRDSNPAEAAPIGFLKEFERS
jgi:hypothetical protein